MKTIFENVILNYSEYSYFKQLPSKDQIHYFFEIYDLHDSIKDNGADSIDLKTFFESVHSSLSDDSDMLDDKVERVDVTIDDENIMIESNSLRAVRHVTNKFIESGYIIQRDVAIEKMFRKDKVTRYIRVFRIIDFITGICLN